MFTTSLKLRTALPTTLREVARVMAFSFFCHPFFRACGLRDLPPTRNILLCNNNHQITMTNNVSGYSVRFLRAAALALALLASPALLINQVAAATFTWNGSTNNYWTSNSNWSGGVAPTQSNTTDLIWAGTTNVSNIVAGANSPLLIRSMTFSDTNDASTTLNLQNANATTTLSRSLTFSSDSGNATLTVAAGSTGNKLINRTTNNAPALFSDVNLTSSLDIVHDGSGTLAFGSQAIIQGAGGINKSGTGTLILNGANTYNGTTTISAGTLQLGNVNALQNTTLDTGTSGSQAVTFAVAGASTYNIAAIQGGDTLDFGNNTISVGANNATTSFTGTLAGSGGSLTKSGTGTLTLSATNTYTGTTTVSAGTLTLSGGSAIGDNGAVSISSGAVLNLGASETVGTIAGAGNITLGSFTLTTNASSDTTLSGVISGSGALTKSGAGTLTLTGANTYTGATTINAGTLQIGDGTTGSLSTSSAVVNNANLLYGTTTTSGTYGLSSSTTGTGSLVATAKLIQLNGNITQSGNVTLASSTNGALYTDGIELVSDTTITAGNIAISGDLGRSAAHGGNLTLDTSATNGAITLNVSISRNGDWYGFNSFTANAGTGNLTISGANAGSGNWRGPSGANLTGALNISSSFTIETTSGTPALNLTATGNSSVTGNLGLYGTTNTWTVNPDLTMTVSGNISGTSAAIAKNGSGTLTLSGNNSYTGTTTINAGTLSMTGVSGYKTTALSVASGATLGITMTGNATSVGANTAGTWTAFNSVNASITGAGVVALNGTNFISAGGSGGTMKTNLSAGAVMDVQSGSWAWGYGRASAATNFGSLNVDSGAEYRNADSASQFDALTGSGTVANSYSGNITITLGVSNTTNNAAYGVTGNTATFSGVIKGPDTYTGVTTGTLNLVKAGTGTQILNGNNTYTGNTTINAGTLEIGAAGRLGAGSYAGRISNNATLIYSGTNNQILSGIISGSGALTQNAASTLTLSNAATAYTGPTSISAGTLSLDFASTSASFASSTTVNAGATLRFAPTANSRITGTAATVDLQGALVYNPSGNFYHVMNSTVTANAPSTIELSAGGITSAGLYLDGGLKGSANVTVISNTNGVGLVLRTSNSNYSGTLTVNGNASTTSGTGSGLMIGNFGSAPALSNANLTINGTLELGNASTGMGWSGSSVSGTTVSINALNGTGVVVGNMQTAASTRTLSVGNNNGSGDFSGVIANGINNTLGFTKNGTGTQTLSGNNTYSGTTTVNAGTLAVSGDIANSGLVINSAGIISPGTSAAADSFGTSSITINGGGYNWTLSSANGSAGTGYDQITSTGALTSSGLLTVYAYGTPGDWDNAANYSWDIFSANSVSGFSSGNFGLNLVNFNNNVTPTGTFAFSNSSGGIIQLTYTAATDPVWTGGTGNWTTGFSANVTNGANIAFAGASGGTATNNIPTGTLTTVGDIEFRLGAGAYSLAADAGAAGDSGGTALTVNGSITNNSTATQTLNTDLAFAATRTIAANTGNITIGGAISGAGGLTKNGSNKLTLTAANTYTGDTTINTGTLEIGSGSTTGSLSSSSAITNNAGLVFNRSNDLTVSNTIGGTGNLTKSGAGTLTLSGSSNYSGTTTISDGALRATHANALGSTAAGTTVASGAALELSGGISIGAEALSLSGTGISSGGALRNISGDNSYAGAITLAAATLINSDSGNLTLSGIMSGSSALTKNGSGRLTLSATNTYTGGTTINGGTLAFTDGTTAAIGNGTITINNGSTLSFTKSRFDSQSIIFGSSGGGSVTTTTTMRFAGTTIYTTGGATNFMNGSLIDVGTPTFNVADGTDDVDLQVNNRIGRSSLTKSGAGKLLLTDSVNNLTAATTINAGVLEIGASGRLDSGNYTLNITNNGALIYSGTNAQTLGGIISGSGALTQNAASTLTLSGNNTYSGTTTINAGTIVIGPAGRLGAGSYAQNISNNGTLIYSGTNAQTLSGIISGTGALTKNAASTLTLSGDNTYSGATTINVGTLVIGNGLTAGSINAASAITVNGTLAFNRSDDITQGTHFSNAAIGGTGSIVQNGAGTLTLNAANNYSGGTTLNTGTVVIGHANAAGSGTITQTDGTSILKIDTTGTITNAMSVYNVLATQSATLSGAITVNNATWDVDAGDTLTVSGNLSGTGGTTKNGTGILVLSGSNSNTGATTVNAGTLNAAGANALGSTSSVDVSNGGSLLVTAGDSINDSAAVTLAGGTLAVNGTFNESVGLLTLSASSVIDLAGFTGTLRFGGVGSWTGGTTLAIWNWNGFNQYGTPVGNGADNRHVVFTSNTGLDSYLGRISFYSDSGSSFAGTGFEQDFSGGGTEIIPVPEPGTRATGILLVLSSGMWLWRKRKQAAWTFCQPAQKVRD